MTKGRQHQSHLRVDPHKPLSKGELPYSTPRAVLRRYGWEWVLGEGSMADSPLGCKPYERE